MGLPELGVYRRAWVTVSEFDSSVLSLGFSTDTVQKQTAAIALKFFSIEVELTMRKLGFHMSAMFCRYFRNWYMACDSRSIRAEQRVSYLLEMHYYLMYFIDFTKMPPPTTHVLGLSITVFEGIMQNITVRILLYSLSKTKTYNARYVYNLLYLLLLFIYLLLYYALYFRAAGTLAVETLFGEAAMQVPSGTGNIRAVDCAKMWSDISVTYITKHDPTK